MKKRNQLLTDNSWIRQRNNSFYKDAPISLKRWVHHLDCDFCLAFSTFELSSFISLPSFFSSYSFCFGSFFADVSHWTTLMYCIIPQTLLLHWLTLAQIRLLGVTLLQTGQPLPATAQDQCYLGEMHTWNMSGTYLVWYFHLSLRRSICHLIIHSGLTMMPCAAPGHSVPGGLAVCVSVSWVVVQPWS